MFETRRFAMMDSSKKMEVLNFLASVGLQNVHGYTCSIVETKTSNEVMKAFIAEATGPKIILDLISDKWNLRKVDGIDGPYYM